MASPTSGSTVLGLASVLTSVQRRHVVSGSRRRVPELGQGLPPLPPPVLRQPVVLPRAPCRVLWPPCLWTPSNADTAAAAAALLHVATAAACLSPLGALLPLTPAAALTIPASLPRRCGHCKNLKPEWTRAAQALKGILPVAAVDADAHRDLGQEVRFFTALGLCCSFVARMDGPAVCKSMVLCTRVMALIRSCQAAGCAQVAHAVGGTTLATSGGLA